MLLFKKILLFILSLFFIILFFIASSTSYAKSEYNSETLEKNVQYNKENDEFLVTHRFNTYASGDKEALMMVALKKRWINMENRDWCYRNVNKLIFKEDL